MRIHAVGHSVLILAFCSLAGCATPLRNDLKRDGAAQWDGNYSWDDGSMVSSDSDTTATELVWEDADGAFQVDNGRIHRTGNESGQSSNRHYMRTVQSDFVSTDWTFAITFHTPPNAPDDIIFIGLGEAVQDSSCFNESRNALNFRIHQGATAFGTGWDVDVMAHDLGYLHWTDSHQHAGSLPGADGGTFTAQIRKTGRQATFTILDTAIAVTIPDIGTAAPFLYTADSRLFFGNASSAYSFDAPVVTVGE